MADTNSHETSGHRNRGFPFLALDDAVDKIRKLYANEGKHIITANVAVGHWGYKPTTSTGKLCLAALKKYGLVEEVSGGNSGKIRLSRRALDIVLLDDNEHHAVKLKAIRDAALTPAIHADLWKMWGPKLPSDATMRAHLIREMGFNDSSAPNFIEEFKQTIAFARLEEAHRENDAQKGDDAQKDSSGAGLFQGENRPDPTFNGSQMKLPSGQVSLPVQMIGPSDGGNK